MFHQHGCNATVLKHCLIKPWLVEKRLVRKLFGIVQYVLVLEKPHHVTIESTRPLERVNISRWRYHTKVFKQGYLCHS